MNRSRQRELGTQLEGIMVGSEDAGTRTAWMDVDAPSYAPLAESTVADVCVVGAGIAGMTTA